MKFPRAVLRPLVAILVPALFLGPLISFRRATAQAIQANSSQDSITRLGPLTLSDLKVTAGSQGVLIEWRTTYELDNLGFNIYREQNGRREQINRGIVPGSALIVGVGNALPGGYSYSRFDPAGTADSRYYLEQVALSGEGTLSESLTPKWSDAAPKRSQMLSLSNAGDQNSISQTEWAGAAAPPTPAAKQNGISPESVNDQWLLANQPALKIGVRTAGWYRITQAEIAAAGFDTSGDSRNLRLLVKAVEIAIRVSRASGALTSADYLEFWATGIDIPSSDTQIYWLVNGAQAGKRIQTVGNLLPDVTQAPLEASPANAAPPAAVRAPWFGGVTAVISGSTVKSDSDRQSNGAEQGTATVLRQEPYADPIHAENPAPSRAKPIIREDDLSNTDRASNNASAASKRGSSPTYREGSRRSGKSKPVRHRHRRNHLRSLRRNHATMVTAAAPAFIYTVERRDKLFNVPGVLNGDADNFFGGLVTATSQPFNIALHNVEATSTATTQLEVSLRGLTLQPHFVNVRLNGTLVGTVQFANEDPAVQTLTVPLASLNEGNNSIQLTSINCSLPNPPQPCNDASLLDYVRLIYPHNLRANSDTLQFTIKSTQTARIDGFTVPNIRVVDITDLTAVQDIHPIVETSGGGFAATIPAATRGKARRLVAIPDTQISHPATLVLNQPSTLNSNTNQADLLVIAYKDFIPALNTPMMPANVSFVTQRTNQGYTVKVVDVDDIYDEFSYGVHSPQAIKDFLQLAKTTWTKKPSYLLLVGDTSYDPRNFLNFGFGDFVPSKPVDTTYMETDSDDSLADFDGDGIPEIAVGRVPARTLAEANLMISKIVNFSPANVPQSALMVADNPVDYDFVFFTEQLVPIVSPVMTVQKVYRPFERNTLSGTLSASTGSTTVTGTGTHFTTELSTFRQIIGSGAILGTIQSISSDTSLTLFANSAVNYSGAYGVQSDAVTHADIINGINSGAALVNYSGHGNIDVWSGVFTSSDALALKNGNRLPFVVVMDCLNGYFSDPTLEGIGESLLKAPNGGAVASFASSGLTIANPQHQMGQQMFSLLYSNPTIPIGDASRQSKGATSMDNNGLDVRRTWILFGDPTMKIR